MKSKEQKVHEDFREHLDTINKEVDSCSNELAMFCVSGLASEEHMTALAHGDAGVICSMILSVASKQPGFMEALYGMLKVIEKTYLVQAKDDDVLS